MMTEARIVFPEPGFPLIDSDLWLPLRKLPRCGPTQRQVSSSRFWAI